MVLRGSIRDAWIGGCKKYVLHIIQRIGGRQRRADHPRPAEFRAQPTIEAYRSE